MLIIISFFGSISVVLKPLWCLMLNGKSWTFATCHFGYPTSEGHLRYNIDENHADLVHFGAVEASVAHVAYYRPWFKRKCSDHFAIEVAIGEVHYSHCGYSDGHGESAFHCAQLSMISPKVLLLHSDHFLLLLLLIARSIQVVMFQYLYSFA